MLHVCTSLNKSLWDSYARNSVLSWVRHLKGDYNLTITLDGVIPENIFSDIKEVWQEENSGSLSVISLDNIPDFYEFMDKYTDFAGPPNTPPHEMYRWDHRRFAPKAFTLYLLVDSYDYSRGSFEHPDPVLWLDADIHMFKDLEITRILKDLTYGRDAVDTVPYSVVCLDRGAPWPNMDSGYLLLDGPEACTVVSYLWNIYDTGCIFHLKEYHDAYLISRVFDILGKVWYEDNVLSLSGKENRNDPRDFLNPMEKTWLNGYMVHLKGNRKGEQV